ncbi:MAG: RuvB-like domain-containing protein [Bacteroidota bacterium]
MHFEFGNQGIIGQHRAKKQVEHMLASERIGHAYLISGPAGSGKTAFALAMAEAINGISHLSDLGTRTSSKKSSWFSHPDIHVFIPMPTSASFTELRPRLELLANDPYELIDFAQRPNLTSGSAAKNRQAFYPIDYFRDHIRPVVKLRPNEGQRIVVIITQVETMRKEASNSFLKILEEPSDRLMFILTTDHYDALLPTITSRCQHITLTSLTDDEVKDGLIRLDGMNDSEADYLARVSGGNYSNTRLFDIQRLKEHRESIIRFLRYSFAQDAVQLSQMIQDWQSGTNIEGLISLLNLMETYLRDLVIWRETRNVALMTNFDQLSSIQKFTDSLGNALLEDMIFHLDAFKPQLRQNVNPKLIFMALSFRFSALMRGKQPVIDAASSYKHLPAFVQ